jgi:hypothetical protein
MIIMNPTVGVAPGTTTMQLGAAPCPPDEPWMYTSPPQVSSALATMTFGPPPPPDVRPQAFDPYGTESRLQGLGQSGTTRWGLIAFAGLATFAAVLGYGYYRTRKHVTGLRGSLARSR